MINEAHLSDIDRVKQALVSAYDDLPTPDPMRLQALENVLAARAVEVPASKLARQPRFWWLIGLLLLGTASAGWWASVQLLSQSQAPASAPPAVHTLAPEQNSQMSKTMIKPEQEALVITVIPAEEQLTAEKNDTPNGEQSQSGSPVLYRGER